MSATNAERARPFAHRQLPFRIRAAQPKDLEQIVSVLIGSFYPQARANQWLYWIVRLGIQEDIRTRLKTPASHYACLAATTLYLPATQSDTNAAGQPCKIVGTAEISQRPCESWQLFAPKRAYLSNLAVNPAYRRQGAARQLLQTCENVALSWGFHRVYLHVMADNEAARALYARAGYQLCEIGNPILSGLGLRPQRLLLSKTVHSSR